MKCKDNFVEVVLWSVMAILIAIVLILVSYDEGYYDAKQEDYCHDYCFTTFALDGGIKKVDYCYNLCMEEESYTNYWKLPNPDVSQKEVDYEN